MADTVGTSEVSQRDLPNPNNEETANSLVNGIQSDDPRLYDLLTLLIEDVYKAANAINPRPSRTFGLTGSTSTTGTVIGFIATLLSNDLRLSWSALSGAISYEIRYLAGTHAAGDWNTAASILTTTTLQADINPATIPLLYGTHTFLLKGTSLDGTQSTTAAVVVIEIPLIGSPGLTSTVIDNFVLLKWTSPMSVLAISYYNVYKNNTFIGKMDGTFEAIFETVAGTYTYKVEAVDIVGNVSSPSTLTATVNQPPDYELTDNRLSDFTGTPTNVFIFTDPNI